MATSENIVTVAQIRAAEARTMRDVPEDVLMDRAAEAVADAAAGLAAERGLALDGLPVCVVAGPGNNGGDALLAGALLARRGARVVAVIAADRAHERGVRALEDAAGEGSVSGVAFPLGRERVLDSQLVIDGFSGIGGRPGLPEDAWSLLGRAVAAGLPIVAVDVPSGLAADSAELPAPDPGARPDVPPRYVVADVTVTFTAPKRCLVEQPAAAAAGRVIVADVGIDLPG
ncbi:NAD(P)H-hydrate epimerase [Demequina sp. SYSU T00192]|uniref:NAD(P)H-hydrate epimerase n=1 Tax=Demequina litoralis TaxID=3051660 RepID=A0ABT8GCG9_9MICO|nr:NAD(P)H-hydrate epimerase [Demequina sp. SYSU T00192]MDN4476831.1 NAD(P)H-hydrate epimerase [Demequina sp. SYSU T00192]